MNQLVFAQAGQLKWAWASGSLCQAGQGQPPVIWLQWTVSRVGVSCPGLSNIKNYSPRAVTETAGQTESMHLLGSWGRVTFPRGQLRTHLPDGGAAVVRALEAGLLAWCWLISSKPSNPPGLSLSHHGHRQHPPDPHPRLGLIVIPSSKGIRQAWEEPCPAWAWRADSGSFHHGLDPPPPRPPGSLHR